MVRGGRAQDCPGVKYTLVRGAMDLVSFSFFSFFFLPSFLLEVYWLRAILTSYVQGGVSNRLTSRSKYGTKKPKKE